MNNLSNNLKKLLHNDDISENELARKTGVSQQIINRILSGENKNPKIATLSPLATYFKVSISQLIGDEIFNREKIHYGKHLGLQEIPIIDWSLLVVSDRILNDNEKILVDIKLSSKRFATKMGDNTMEPKFSKGSLLIFDSNIVPSEGDFVLLGMPDNEVIVRQFLIKNNEPHQRCLNPDCKDYKLTPIHKESKHLGLLIQSTTNHVDR